MATQSLGNLQVEIGADDKGLDTAVKKTDASLKKLGNSGTAATDKVSKGVKALSLSFVALVSGIQVAVAKTIQANTELNRLAQSLGLTVEEMSNLNYIAKASGVGVDKLRAAVVTLVKGLDEASGDNAIGPVATALRALGISATKASGELKTATEVMREAADEFASLKDGSNKTALAVALFGEAGSELIPILNKGSAGLKQMEEAAAGLGVTIDGRTARAADQLTNTFGKVVSTLTGVIQLATNQLVPIFQRIAEGFLEWSNSSNFVKTASDALVVATKLAISVFYELKTAISSVSSVLYGLGKGFVEFATLEFAKGVEAIKAGIAEANKTIEENEKFQADMWNGWIANIDYASKETPVKIAPVLSSIKSWEEATRELHDANVNMLGYLLEQDTLPIEQKMAAIDQAVRNGTIGWREYGNMVRAVNQTAQQQMDGLLQQTTQVLGSVFKESKGVGIATALINTYQGVTKALATLPPPYSYVAAALTAAQGFAQVAAIRSTSSSGGGSPAARPTGGGGGGVAAARTNGGGNRSSGAQSPQQSLIVHGIGPKQLFSGDAVRELAARLLDFQKDGGKVILAAT